MHTPAATQRVTSIRLVDVRTEPPYQRPRDTLRLKTTPDPDESLTCSGGCNARGEPLVSNEMDEIVQEFLVESYEALDRLDKDLLTLEKDPSSKETVQSIFRVMHTIKGTCGFLGFTKLERVAHAAESLLGEVRDGSLEVTPPIASALLTTGDALRTMLGSIERDGNDG